MGTIRRNRIRRYSARALLGGALSGILALAGSAAAVPDPGRNDATPTGWAWYTHVSEPALSSYIKRNKMRLIDIEVVKAKPTRFASAMVHNSGGYGRSWHWYYGLSFNQATTLKNITSGRERVLDVESYVRNGKRRYAVLLVDNRGQHKTGWKWYLNVTPGFIKNHRKNFRIIDLDRRSGSKRYDVVMVRNKGKQARKWWYYYKRTPGQVANLLKKKNARLVDLERDGNRFTVVMVRNTGIKWWWYHGVRPGQITEFINQNGARVVDIERYRTGGKTRYGVVMVNNLDPLSTKIRGIMAPGAGRAAYGFYAKKVGGPVVAALQSTKVFEPASAVKALHHLHSMREVEDNQASLTQFVDWYAHPDFPARYPNSSGYAEDKNVCAYEPDGTPILSTKYSDPLGPVILKQMMERSDNRATDAVVNLFGLSAINDTADDVGMSQTEVNHRIGCPGSSTSNELTLRDIGRLYEGVADGTELDSSLRDEFYDYMPQGTSGWFGVVDQEAAALGMSAGDIAAFKEAIRGASKGGSYTNGVGCPSGTSGVCQLLRRTGAGVVYLPFRTGRSGSIVLEPYVYGSFVDGPFSCGPSNVVEDKETACDDEITTIGMVRSAAHREMMRGPIRQALQTW